MNRTHGMRKSSEYSVWIGMKTRCYNKNEKCYSRYGGRGITVCDRWRHSFKNFIVDMGKRPTGTTIERIDNSKGYSSNNCKWATHSEQMHNRRGFGNTGVLGIHKVKHGYQALITKNRIRYFLGTFKSLREAKEAYDTKAKELYV